jgi:hypothetical protein
MTEIVALVCTLMSPLQCRDLHLVFAAEQVTPFQCFLYGQTELGKWVSEHPGWQIKHGFKCAPLGRYAKI